MELSIEVAAGEKVNTEKLTRELGEFGSNMGIKWDDQGQALAVVLDVSDKTDVKEVQRIIKDHIASDPKTDGEEIAEKEAAKPTLESLQAAIEELGIRLAKAGI